MKAGGIALSVVQCLLIDISRRLRPGDLMKAFALVVSAVLLLAQPVQARITLETPASATAATPVPQAGDKTLVESGTYVNKAGHVVHVPAHTVGGSAPDGATALCGDNTWSFSQSRRGTCSHHGGVARWM